MASILDTQTGSRIPRDRIVEYLRGRIVAGAFMPGARLPTLTELERLIGASRTTLQASIDVLRAQGFVVPQGRRGTFVHPAPPHLCHFGLVFSYRHGAPRWLQFHKSWEAEARLMEAESKGGSSERRFTPYYDAETSASSASHAALVSAVESQQHAGLIIMDQPFGLMGSPPMTAPSLPRVVVTTDRIPGCTILHIDKALLLIKALDHLAARGRRRVAFVIGEQPWVLASETLSMVLPLVEARGMETRRYWVLGAGFDSMSWAAHSVELLMHCSRSDRPDALIITDDNLVPDATRALAESAVDVPGELEVVAQANAPYPTPSAVPATRLSYDVRWMLKTSVGIIERKLRGGQVPDEIRVRPRFDDEPPTAESGSFESSIDA